MLNCSLILKGYLNHNSILFHFLMVRVVGSHFDGNILGILLDIRMEFSSMDRLLLLLLVIYDINVIFFFLLGFND